MSIAAAPPRDELPVAPFQEAAAPSPAAAPSTGASASGEGLKLIFLDIDGGAPTPGNHFSSPCSLQGPAPPEQGRSAASARRVMRHAADAPGPCRGPCALLIHPCPSRMRLVARAGRASPIHSLPPARSRARGCSSFALVSSHLFCSLSCSVICCNGIGRLETDKMARIRDVVKQTGAKVVLSTDWRRDATLKATVTHALREQGIEVIGATRKGPPLKPIRPQEIWGWLELYQREKGKVVSEWVAVDDRELLAENGGDNLRGHFVNTNFATGLTDRARDRMIAVLNGNHDEGMGSLSRPPVNRAASPARTKRAGSPARPGSRPAGSPPGFGVAMDRAGANGTANAAGRTPSGRGSGARASSPARGAGRGPAVSAGGRAEARAPRSAEGRAVAPAPAPAPAAVAVAVPATTAAGVPAAAPAP